MQLTITPNFAQERALNMLRRDWKSHNTFMVYAPTGSGKTGLAAFIVAGFVSRGMRVLFCAPYTILIGQTANRFVEYGLPGDEIGYIWADHPNYDPDRKIQIASADTLIRRVFPDNIDLLIIDEAHLRKKRILQDIERLRGKGVKVIGLSGTPFSPFLGKYYDRLIKPTTIGELIQRGDLSKYEFYAPTKPDLKGVKTKSSLEYGNDYNETQLAEIMCGSTLVGDIVQNWLENGRDLPTIAFCVNVAYANFLTIQFNQTGVNAEVMTADTPVDERQTIIHRFETGATKIIVSVGVLVAGFDSDVRCIIYARPTKSEIRWLQALGRGLRTAPGKESCLIFDHSGTVHRLGYPDSIEYDDLPGKSDGMEESARRAAEERAEKLPHECSQCHYMKPAGPKCGHKPLGGEDVDTDTGRKLKKLGKDQHHPTKAEKQAWWSQIKFYQRQRVSQGKKPVSDGWCANTFRERFDEWPNGLSDFPMEITPTVSNFIRHKLIAYAKGQEKAKRMQVASGAPAPSSIRQAQKVISDIKQQLGKQV
ncbi:DEAD/DEAH box helicase [Salmonella enterica]|uniref:DEAD/DEAH box helicase n=1 Tax=Salmonella enterica TaxID=28901 RepID=UPI000BE23E76|nr:DEAD/DEAH box helicase [Salmonella enterica]ATI93427.1 helicase [Salmonella enterica subsp. enterica]EAQ4379743.1 DEAD/DEAH box helicase [Salmonella enterica subsp. enterica serovar Javiana]ECH8185711.1 DEAD/DEAH box helicase [Salmonella enterica subsp. enterica serovar Rissen]EEJ1464039.1 DEAD/DEAH box helicase [Salmonella enterica subsp. enterica serovar Virginia]EEJ6876257.1 DEAD/DEAH box helicase [Salmonella enterica subsp. houtenae]EGF6410935.1 DEAD/DEAH box helicase [Salmonella enter